MPQKQTQATVNKLIKGLITEAGELTFPEDASIDELNCVLNRDGSRERRKGLAAITDSSTLSFDFETNGAYFYYNWKNVGGNVGLNFICIQHSNTISFIDPSFTPITDGLKSFGIDVTAYLSPLADSGVSDAIQFTQIFGTLIISSPKSETLVVQYDRGTDSLTVNTINFTVRDFQWQSDTTLFSTEASIPPSIERQYDTYNASWFGEAGTAALEAYISERSAYPPLTLPWFSAKNSSGNYSTDEFINTQTGTSVTGNGLFKLDFFAKDRSTASGIPGFIIEEEHNRFASVATYAGRLWYAGLGGGKNSGKILFTQSILNADIDNLQAYLGVCHQINDPTAEDFSDILDTDGGEILISEANNIKKLYVYNESLFVFAENGVWVVNGVDGRFSPSSYYISKISSIGIDATQSFISAENIPFWWSNSGIHTIRFDEGSGFPIEENISLATVQTLFGELTPLQRSKIVSDYDMFNKRIYWWYPSADEVTISGRNEALILDISLKAFYPWSIAGTGATPGSHHIGSFYVEPSSLTTVLEDVTVASGDVTVASGTVYTLDVEGGSYQDIRLVSIYYSSSVYRVGQYTDIAFVDFGSRNYESYFESGYFFGGDLLLKKNTPFVTVYLRSTEEGFTGNETIGYTAINSSSLLLSAYWDFKKTAATAQQTYRIKPFAIVNTADLTNNQQQTTVITTRLKVRGKGRSMRLRFAAEAGKNFIFLGYSILVGINDRF